MFRKNQTVLLELFPSQSRVEGELSPRIKVAGLPQRVEVVAESSAGL